MSEMLTVSIDSERAAAMTEDEWAQYWDGQGASIRAQALAMSRIAERGRRSRAQVARHEKKEG